MVSMLLELMLCSVNQRYNLKAIHNRTAGTNEEESVVFSQSKIQSKSNSQPPNWGLLFIHRCVQSIKDTI